jgi:hypothetical protein
VDYVKEDFGALAVGDTGIGNILVIQAFWSGFVFLD